MFRASATFSARYLANPHLEAAEVVPRVALVALDARLRVHRLVADLAHRFRFLLRLNGTRRLRVVSLLGLKVEHLWKGILKTQFEFPRLRLSGHARQRCAWKYCAQLA